MSNELAATKKVAVVGCLLKLTLVISAVSAVCVGWWVYNSTRKTGLVDLREGDVIYLVNATTGRWLIDSRLDTPVAERNVLGQLEKDYGHVVESQYQWGTEDNGPPTPTAWTVRKVRELDNGRGIAFQLVSASQRKLIASPIRYGPPELWDAYEQNDQDAMRGRLDQFPVWGTGSLPTTSTWKDTVAVTGLKRGTSFPEKGEEVLSFEVTKSKVVVYGAKGKFTFASLRDKSIPSYRISRQQGNEREFLHSQLTGPLKLVTFCSVEKLNHAPDQWYFIRASKTDAKDSADLETR